MVDTTVAVPGAPVATFVTPTPRSKVVLETVAVVLTLACVWLTGRESLWCWPVGIVGAALYIYVFGRARLYSDVLLQVYFIITSIYGWIVWQAGNGGADELAVSHLGPWQWALWAAVVAVGIAVLGTLMRRYTSAALPYWDATIATLSLVAQYFLAAKYVESWVLWVSVDALAIGVYAVRRLYQTALLYLVLEGLAINGLVTWVGKLGG